MTDQRTHPEKQTLSEEAAREAQRLKNQAKSALDSAAQRAKEQGRETAHQMQDSAGRQADKLANAERAAANQLREDNLPTLSHIAEQMADGFNRFASQIRHKNIDELVHDVGEFGRKNPVLFIAGSIAAGALLMRLAKASDQREPEETDASPYADTAQDYQERERTARNIAESSPQAYRPTTSTTPRQN